MHKHPKLIACPYCDVLYKRPLYLARNEKLTCKCCGSTMIDGRANFYQAFIYALTALILFVIANAFPFITLSLQGEITTISVFSSVQSLFNNGLPILALLVMLFVIIMPLWYLTAVLWIIVSFRYQFLNTLSRRFLHWMHYMAPWNMLEVYLVGVVVTLVKIMQMASVQFDKGFWAFCALMICSIFVDSRFDLNDAIFEAYQKPQIP
ncbi:Inner membrane protein yebS [Suttonella ornithocola]|uniref:Inner membrane protein yebS n=2 Tax=Suttonella ornithocola TaxID=279832 RepID=A0A380N144_9GAMM|nr:Inner membrane protein yebS [Suttonella ornithocola]